MAARCASGPTGWPRRPAPTPPLPSAREGARRIAIGGDAGAYLVAHLGGDRLVTRQELEKLTLYVGDGGRVELADAVACIGETNSLSVDELVYAAADGEPVKLDNALLRCLQEGQAPISILRATMRRFH